MHACVLVGGCHGGGGGGWVLKSAYPYVLVIPLGSYEMGLRK